MTYSPSLTAHLASGVTTLCRCWALTRRDGVVLGFTDHDRDLTFGGIVFVARSGMTARALQQGTGLSVDNSEAMGALSDGSITETDILAGRYDGAEVDIWLVNWQAVIDRAALFSGSLGEMRRAGGAFSAEMRGLTETLNQPQGRVYQPQCSAILGDAACGFDLSISGYVDERPTETVEDQRLFQFEDFAGFDDRWFERGRLRVITGAAAGLSGIVKNDRLANVGRTVELWQRLGVDVAPGDVIRIEAGCDKRVTTCRLKFNNFNNFRGFPHIPGEDWLMAYPRQSPVNTGGSLLG